MTAPSTSTSLAAISALCILAAISLAAGDNGVGWMDVGSSAPQHYNGDGTYYGASQDNAGSCGYGPPFANSLNMEWKTGLNNYIALNAAQYSGGLGCGLCVMYRGLGQGLGQGLGTVPIPSDWKMAMVDNQCPECAYGGIDLSMSGDGRWKIEWYPIECNVGPGTFRYDMQGSPSRYWFAFTVSNTRIPIQNVEMQQNDGSWYSLRRSFPDNHWAANGGPFTFPLSIRLTSVHSDTVVDSIPSLSGGQGNAQFPSITAPASNSTSNVGEAHISSANQSTSAGASAGRRLLGYPRHVI